MISNSGGNRIAVPYMELWQVFLNGPPVFNAGNTTNTSQVNISQLQSDIANQHLRLLAIFDANTDTPQMVRCPLQCAIAPPANAVPVIPPGTGGLRFPLASVFLVSGVLLSGTDLSLYFIQDEINR